MVLSLEATTKDASMPQKGPCNASKTRRHTKPSHRRRKKRGSKTKKRSCRYRSAQKRSSSELPPGYEPDTKKLQLDEDSIQFQEAVCQTINLTHLAINEKDLLGDGTWPVVDQIWGPFRIQFAWHVKDKTVSCTYSVYAGNKTLFQSTTPHLVKKNDDIIAALDNMYDVLLNSNVARQEFLNTNVHA